MRGVLLALAFAFVLAGVAPATSSASGTSSALTISAAAPVYALQQPEKGIDINVDINKGGGRAWYTSPVWIAIGVIGVVLVLLLIVLIARGGGTTIVKE